jgi:hypothetical protein
VFRARIVWCALCVSILTACDAVVTAGQTTTFGNRGSVFAVNTPNAVIVQPGGTLVVEDADLFGRGRVIALRDAPVVTGSAIAAEGGVVRVIAGTLVGGNLVVDPNAPRSAPPDPSSLNSFIDVLSPALQASHSNVEIEGGTFVASGAFGSVAGGFDDLPPRFISFASTIVVSDSQLRIRGGIFRPGARNDDSRVVGGALTATRSAVVISGGRFDEGVVDLSGSQSRLLGGRFGALLLGGSPSLVLPPDPPGCTEIVGGALRTVRVTGIGEQVFVFGSRFSLPLGPVAVPPPMQVTLPSLIGGLPSTIDVPTPFTLAGVLADGSALDVRLAVGAGATVVLASPGTPGCTP